jgi:hypothetical protein
MMRNLQTLQQEQYPHRIQPAEVLKVVPRTVKRDADCQPPFCP